MTPKQLKKWRLKNNLTQVQAAELLELSRSHYQNIESGKWPIKKAVASIIILHDLQK
jgi:transcriptional regulator with XRE-family HTH domain